MNWVWKRSIKDQNYSNLNRSGGFKPKRSQSDSRSDWRELKKEPGFGQELQIEEDQNNWYIYSPVESPDLLVGIFHLLQIARCSTGLNGLDPEQIEDRGWRLSLDAIDTWKFVMLRSLPCVPAISFNTQTYWNYQNIIYWSMLVTKESNNIHVKSNNNNNVGWKSTCIKIENG